MKIHFKNYEKMGNMYSIVGWNLVFRNVKVVLLGVDRNGVKEALP